MEGPSLTNANSSRDPTGEETEDPEQTSRIVAETFAAVSSGEGFALEFRCNKKASE